MPVAVPLIAAAAAATTYTAAAGFAFSAGTFFVSAALGYAAQALQAKPASPEGSLFTAPGGGRTQQVRQPITPHNVIFGRIKTSGAWMFVASGPDDTGRADGYFYVQHVLASHHCRAIGDIYLNDNLSTDAQYAGLVTVNKHLGTVDQLEDATFLADLGSAFTDHRLRGRANIASRLKGSSAAYPNGLPNISAIVEGCDEIYDPRSGAISWSNNVALCIAKWFSSGFGMALDWTALDEDSVIASANVCDERVLVAPRGTAFTAAPDALTLVGSGIALDVGDGFRVTTNGTLPTGLSADTTYYAIPADNGTIRVATSVANALIGFAFPLPDNGTGTHVIWTWDEARYKINGSFTLDVAKRDVLEQMLSAMAGTAVYIGGKWFIHAGAAAAPTVTLNEDDLRSDLSNAPKRSLRDKFNGVRAVYVDPGSNWQPVDAPPLRVAAYVAEDDGEELYRDVRYPFTTSTRAVQRLMKIDLQRNRRQRTVSYPSKLSAMRLQPWEGVYVSNVRYSWEQEQFRVVGWALTDDGGVNLTLQEDDADVYAWNAAEELEVSEPQAVTVPDPSTIAAPASVSIAAITTPSYPRIDAMWDEVKSIWLDGYDVEYRASGSVDWLSYGRVGSSARVAQIERTSATDIQVRAVTRNGSTSAFRQNLAPAAPTGVSAIPDTGEIDLAWTNGAGATGVQIFSNATNDFLTATLLATVTGIAYANTGLSGGDTRYYWLRSKNAGDNLSAQTASVNATAS